MKKWIIALIAAVLVVALVGGGFAWLAGQRDDGPPPATGEQAPSGLARFYAQKLSWKPCGSDRCTQVEVPVDYDQPDGDTLQLAVRRVPATGAGGQAIFVNPGGPGGSAQDFVGYVASELPASIRRTHDVIGVDPRGVGESTPLQCLKDSAFDDFIDTDPDPDDEAGIDALTASVRSMGEACTANSGALAAHVSTEEAARDHDVVRALLGQKKMVWFGFSYGTQLGATYAQLFPDKFSRMVLDVSVDVTRGAIDQALGQTEGFQRALEAYLKACVAAKDCPVGDTVAEGMDTMADLMQRLSKDPIKVPSGRLLTEGRAFYGIAVTLYSRDSWDYLTQALRGAVNGDGRLLLTLSDQYFERKSDGSFANNSGQVIYAVNCLDTDDAPDRAATQAALPQFRAVSPVFGAALGWGAMACHDWPIRGDHPQQPVTAAGAPPILVVGTTRDPATPYEWSQAMASQLESGVLLTREGDGHTAYTSGNQCIKDAVDAYLEDGTVPKDGTVCPEE